MSLNVSCPQCGKQYRVPDSVAGRRACCKACGGVMTIPAANADLETLSEMKSPTGFGLLDELPGSSETADSSTPPLDDGGPTLAPVQYPKQRPVKKHKQTITHGGLDKGTWWTLVLLSVGGVLLFIGQREWRLASLAGSIPQRMTLAELADRGPGNNIFIELSDVCLLPERAIICTVSHNFGPEQWEYVWIPATSRERPGFANAPPVKVIVGTNSCRDETQLDGFCQKTTLQGLIVNETDSLNKEERKLLNEGLPSVDVASCYLFRVGQKPASRTVQGFLLGGGLLVVLAGMVVGVFRLRSWLGR